MRNIFFVPNEIVIFIYWSLYEKYTTIFNEAISNKIISSDLYPFGKGKYVSPATKQAKKALSLEDIGKIYNYKALDPIEAWAKDMELFAYFANGINVRTSPF